MAVKPLSAERMWWSVPLEDCQNPTFFPIKASKQKKVIRGFVS